MMITSRFLRLSMCVLIISAITSCSSSTVAPEQEVQVTELSLFLTRRSLSGTEFEQYKLSGNGNLFVECGKITGGRYVPIFQTMDSLRPENQLALSNALSKMITSANYEKGSFDKPGKNSSLFDPGKFEISFSARPGSSTVSSSEPITGNVSTSLDAVVKQSNKAEKELFKLAKAIRTGVSFYEPICDNRDFYGLPGIRYPNSHG